MYFLKVYSSKVYFSKVYFSQAYFHKCNFQKCIFLWSKNFGPWDDAAPFFTDFKLKCTFQNCNLNFFQNVFYKSAYLQSVFSSSGKQKFWLAGGCSPLFHCLYLTLANIAQPIMKKVIHLCNRWLFVASIGLISE